MKIKDWWNDHVSDVSEELISKLVKYNKNKTVDNLKDITNTNINNKINNKTTIENTIVKLANCLETAENQEETTANRTSLEKYLSSIKIPLSARILKQAFGKRNSQPWCVFVDSAVTAIKERQNLIHDQIALVDLETSSVKKAANAAIESTLEQLKNPISPRQAYKLLSNLHLRLNALKNHVPLSDKKMLAFMKSAVGAIGMYSKLLFVVIIASFIGMKGRERVLEKLGALEKKATLEKNNLLQSEDPKYVVKNKALEFTIQIANQCLDLLKNDKSAQIPIIIQQLHRKIAKAKTADEELVQRERVWVNILKIVQIDPKLPESPFESIDSLDAASTDLTNRIDIAATTKNLIQKYVIDETTFAARRVIVYRQIIQSHFAFTISDNDDTLLANISALHKSAEPLKSVTLVETDDNYVYDTIAVLHDRAVEFVKLTTTTDGGKEEKLQKFEEHWKKTLREIHPRFYGVYKGGAETDACNVITQAFDALSYKIGIQSHTLSNADTIVENIARLSEGDDDTDEKLLQLLKEFNSLRDKKITQKIGDVFTTALFYMLNLADVYSAWHDSGQMNSMQVIGIVYMRLHAAETFINSPDVEPIDKNLVSACKEVIFMVKKRLQNSQLEHLSKQLKSPFNEKRFADVSNQLLDSDIAPKLKDFVDFLKTDKKTFEAKNRIAGTLNAAIALLPSDDESVIKKRVLEQMKSIVDNVIPSPSSETSDDDASFKTAVDDTIKSAVDDIDTIDVNIEEDKNTAAIRSALSVFPPWGNHFNFSKSIPKEPVTIESILANMVAENNGSDDANLDGLRTFARNANWVHSTFSGTGIDSLTNPLATIFKNIVEKLAEKMHGVGFTIKPPDDTALSSIESINGWFQAHTKVFDAAVTVRSCVMQRMTSEGTDIKFNNVKYGPFFDVFHANDNQVRVAEDIMYMLSYPEPASFVYGAYGVSGSGKTSLLINGINSQKSVLSQIQSSILDYSKQKITPRVLIVELYGEFDDGKCVQLRGVEKKPELKQKIYAYSKNGEPTEISDDTLIEAHWFDLESDDNFQSIMKKVDTSRAEDFSNDINGTGTEERHIRPTPNNAASSRSHLAIVLECTVNDIKKRVVVLDMGGSENVDEIQDMYYTKETLMVLNSKELQKYEEDVLRYEGSLSTKLIDVNKFINFMNTVSFSNILTEEQKTSLARIQTSTQLARSLKSSMLDGKLPVDLDKLNEHKLFQLPQTRRLPVVKLEEFQKEGVMLSKSDAEALRTDMGVLRRGLKKACFRCMKSVNTIFNMNQYKSLKNIIQKDLLTFLTDIYIPRLKEELWSYIASKFQTMGLTAQETNLSKELVINPRQRTQILPEYTDELITTATVRIENIIRKVHCPLRAQGIYITKTIDAFVQYAKNRAKTDGGDDYFINVFLKKMALDGKDPDKLVVYTCLPVPTDMNKEAYTRSLQFAHCLSPFTTQDGEFHNCSADVVDKKSGGSSMFSGGAVDLVDRDTARLVSPTRAHLLTALNDDATSGKYQQIMDAIEDVRAQDAQKRDLLRKAVSALADAFQALGTDDERRAMLARVSDALRDADVGLTLRLRSDASKLRNSTTTATATTSGGRGGPFGFGVDDDEEDDVVDAAKKKQDDDDSNDSKDAAKKPASASAAATLDPRSSAKALTDAADLLQDAQTVFRRLNNQVDAFYAFVTELSQNRRETARAFDGVYDRSWFKAFKDWREKAVQAANEARAAVLAAADSDTVTSPSVLRERRAETRKNSDALVDKTDAWVGAVSAIYEAARARAQTQRETEREKSREYRWGELPESNRQAPQQTKKEALLTLDADKPPWSVVLAAHKELDAALATALKQAREVAEAYNRLANPLMAAALSENPYARLFNAYLSRRAENEPVAREALVSGLKANRLVPRDVLQITTSDRLVFVFLTLVLRSLAISAVSALVERGAVRTIAAGTALFVGFYLAFFTVFVVVVNMDLYRTRIVFNYINLHANAGSIVAHVGVLLLMSWAIYLIIQNIATAPSKAKANASLTDAERSRLVARLQLLSMIVWVALAITIALA